MIKKNNNLLPSISVVIVHRNSSSTILLTLEGLKKQTYPIKEIIIVDNNSTDDSLSKISNFSKVNSDLNIKILLKTTNTGVSNSYNMGVRAAKYDNVIIMQADGVLPSKQEISVIMAPVLEDSSTVASTPITLMPKYVWNKYNFWEKCMFCGTVDRDALGFNGKFDYVNKKLYFKAGGFDEKNFYAGVGGEDADLTMRLKKIGQLAYTKARVVHLHYLGENYSMMNWILNRKLYARSYGKIIGMHKQSLPFDVLAIAIKPILVFSSFITFLFPYNFLAMIVFSFWYMRKMYTDKVSLLNPKIILLPFISIFLLYYESYWMIEGYFLPKRIWKGTL